MKKFATIALAVVLSMGILTGCGSSKKAAEATTEVKEETVDYGQGLNEDGTLEGVKATDYVTVCDYSALKIPKKEVKVSDSDVQTEIDTILSSYNQVTDRKVKKGDTVNIDYKGMIDGKEFDGGTASGASLKIGSGTFVDGFENQLIGKMPGETVQVKVTFPKDYQGKEVAGKDAVFETTINYIDETPKLTDKFVKEKLSDRYGYTTVKEMKKTIRDEIFKTNKTDYIWNHMIEKSKFKEIPDELINDRVDVLVNNAGITKDGLLMRMKENDFDAVIDVNLKGTWNCMKHATKLMMKQKYGRIVSMSSVVGVMGNAGQVNYAASKSGIIGMTMSLAREVGSRGITVNAVAPGFIQTAMTDVLSDDIKEQMKSQIPLGTFGSVQDIANAVVFLASDEAKYITGQTLHVDGGMAM